MTPVIHCSAGNINFFAGTTFIQHNKIQFTKRNVSGNCTRLTSSSQRFLLARPSLRLFHSCKSGFLSKDGSRIGSIAAAGGADVKLEEPNTSVSSSGEIAENKTVEAPTITKSVETTESTKANTNGNSPPRSKRSRGPRRSDMPPVKNEDLIPGASFTGKVRSIQPFGAFIDFGAFTNGLVHVSRMSEGYVKDVGSLVSVGQEVKVRIVEANMETGRISLTMRENDDASKSQQQRRENPTSSSGSSDRPRSTGRKNAVRSTTQQRDEVQRSSKFVLGQVLNGTVKNIIRAGSFIALPDGEEGFIPVDEESGGFENVMGSSSLQVGQEVTARVLRFSRGKVTLTMKKEEADVKELNRQLSKGVVQVATNPFELAFRRNKDIAAFLDERDRAVKPSSENDTSLQPKTTSEQGEEDKIDADTTTKSDTPTVESSSSELDLSGAKEQVSNLPDNVEPVPETLSEDNGSSTTASISDSETKDSVSTIETVEEEQINSLQSSVSDESESVDENKEDPTSEVPIDEVISNDEVKEPEISSAIVLENDATSVSLSSLEDGDSEVETVSAAETVTAVETVVEGQIAEQIASSQVEVAEEEDASTQADTLVVEDKLEVTEKTVLVENEVAPAYSNDNGQTSVSASLEDGDSEVETVSAAETVAAVETVEEGQIAEQIVSSQVEVVEEEDASTQADTLVVEDKLEVTEKTVLVENEVAPADSNDNGQTSQPDQASATKAMISPALVKQLREDTGAGMMDCKKALSETGGDIVKAQEFLRKKGLASADKKASRATAEGRIGSYIHDGRIGVLIEVNCETDFVSRGEIFKELVDDLAMQVAACPQVRYLVTEDVPEEFVNKEREIEMQKEDLLKKPEQIRQKIVDGRINKRLEEFALLEQPYIKNDKIVLKDWVKQTIATVGENIKVKRFIRFNLGEGLEKRSQDFAAEVAAQTVAKESPTAPKDQPVEAKETVEKPATVVAVSAALVKQLREETGAGMMDCKKALSETGGDIEKAQEYLRKKGLSSADKKSSRLAAEGRISSYVHDTRIGCLIEVNSETDFVARNEKFKEMVDDLAMQVVACPQVEYVSIEDIPESVVNREKELEMQRDDLKSKPESIREKIVEGRISKRLGELALLEQPFIKDDKVVVKDLLKQTVAALGENIRVRRFARFTLGETAKNQE